MAKTKISEYDSISSNNTDIDSINIAEGCAPSGINNAIRELMAHIRDFQSGASGDTFTSANVAITGGAISGISTLTDKTSATGSVIVSTGTQAQRDVSPSAGYFRFNSDTGSFEGYNGTVWGSVGGGATGGGNDAVFVENDQVVTTDYTIPASKNAMSTGPVTINSGVTVSVSTGSRWVIL